MSTRLHHELSEALADFGSDKRLYALSFSGADGGDSLGGWLVEAFAADECLSQIGWRDVIVLAASASIRPTELLGRHAALHISLADRTRAGFSGFVSNAQVIGSDGGFTRVRIRLRPWLWHLTQTSNSRAWQDKRVTEIVDEVLADYAPQARWRWSADTRAFLAGVDPRSYCVQYRESDYDFLERLLSEEGLSWRCEDDGDGQMLVLFADSRQASAAPRDASSARLGAIRYHASGATEQADGIDGLETRRKLIAAKRTVASYDYKAKRLITATVVTNLPLGGKHAPALESYDYSGQYSFKDEDQARRHATLWMEAQEARAQSWQMHSTVRTMRAGTSFTLADGPFKKANGEFTIVRVRSIGVNNLPATANRVLDTLFGPVQALLDPLLVEGELIPETAAKLAEKARLKGYANYIDAIKADRPWRPASPEDLPRRTAPGSQTAIVVGRDGSDVANGADEIHCDRLGRVRIRFHWQKDDASCWVRVGQRLTGGRMGSQFLPRIGQEVMVQFMEGDIDRPVIIGAMYNGLGEGGVAPTPAGATGAAANPRMFTIAQDDRVSGQGNLAGGNSAVWHGAAAGRDQHANNAAQWGIRSKELGGKGYNQLVFDDTDGQGRVQLKCSFAASELNLGHLVHTADNYRGSFRGTGAELRTDAYGAVRAGAGLLISSYGVRHAADSRDPAGENAAGIDMLSHAKTVLATLSDAAVVHETVALASHVGVRQGGLSSFDDRAAPMKSMWSAAAGMVSTDSLAAAQRKADGEASGAGKVPHSAAPIIAIAAQSGLGVVAGQDVQLVSGETVTLLSGADTQFVSGGQLRLHSGQAIGVVAGAEKPDDSGMGLQLIAAKDPIDLQAQTGEIKVQARDAVNVVSANAHIDWAAAKSISLSTAGGANITIAGGNITVQCPGKLTVHAGMKAFSGPARMSYPLPVMPSSEMPKEKINFRLLLRDMPGAYGQPYPERAWNLVRFEGSAADAVDPALWRKVLAKGTTDANGECLLAEQEKLLVWREVMQRPQGVWLVSAAKATPVTFARLAASKGEAEIRKTLDALNYGVSQGHLDDEHQKFLRQWAEQDYGASLGAKPETDTKA
ncbi:MAG: type VI secretion system Vgr family protein [Massilia sp.]